MFPKAKKNLTKFIDNYADLMIDIAMIPVNTDEERRQHNERLTRAMDQVDAVELFSKELMIVEGMGRE